MRLRNTDVSMRREADLTGMINVVFLILIFFIVAGALRPFSARNIELATIAPDAGNTVAPAQLIVHQDGRIVWRGTDLAVADIAAAVPVLDETKTFIIVADSRLSAARLLETTRALRSAGHKSVAVMSERQRQR